MISSKSRRNRGFSLLEVLVAFVILGLVLGSLMNIFSGGLRNVGRSGEYQRAVLLAQSKLASVGIETPLKESESNGEFDSTFRWQTSIRPFLEPTPPPEPVVPGLAGAPAAPMPAIVLPVNLLEVEVKVLWGANDQSRVVTLKTLRIANKAVL
ncbi:N/A [soil metagenome]